MKNGVKHMNHPSNIGPVFGKRIIVGPDIDVPGWNQTYASPYLLPVTKPTEWNGPDRPDFTRGRHPFRTVPRGPGYVLPTDNPQAPPYAHGVGGMGMVIRGYGGCTSCMGQDEPKTPVPVVAVVLVGAMAYGLFMALKEGLK